MFSPDAFAGVVVFEGVAERLRGKSTRAISRQKQKTEVSTLVTGEESSLFEEEGEARSRKATENRNRKAMLFEGLRGRPFEFVTTIG